MGYVFEGHAWEEMMQFAQMPAVEFVAVLQSWGWEEAHGLFGDCCSCGDGVGLADVDLEGDFEVYLEGYWADESPVVEFEDGHVARWYRAEAWD